MLLQFYELTLKTLREEIEQYLSRLEQGRIQNFEEFRDVSGRIYGLKTAEEIIKKIFDDVQMPNKT